MFGNSKVNIATEKLKAEAVMALVSDADWRDWTPFDWSVYPAFEHCISDRALARVARIASVAGLDLLVRLQSEQMQFAHIQLETLLDECEWLYYLTDDYSVREDLQEFADFVSEGRKLKLWLVVSRPSLSPRKLQHR